MRNRLLCNYTSYGIMNANIEVVLVAPAILEINDPVDLQL